MDTTLKSKLDPHLSRDRCKQLLLDLVRVESPQTALLEKEPLLRQFIKTAVEPRLRDMGVDAIRYDDMGNLIAELGCTNSGKSLMFVAHAMNQPPATMQNAYAGEVLDGKPFDLPGEVIRGRGASEQKSTMAAMFHALEAVLQSGAALDGRLYFVCCVSGETGRDDAIRHVVEREGVRADLALVYGNSLKLQLGNRGRIDMEVGVIGKPSHSSRPAEGCNAVTGTVEVIRRLVSEINLDRQHAELGRATLTINRVRSFPESTHTVPGRCEIGVDRRLLPGEDPDDAAAEIEAVAKKVDGMIDPVSGKPLQVVVAKGAFMHPSLLARDAPVVRQIVKSCVAMLGREPETVYGKSAFDQGYLNHIGISTANFGPGEEKYAHTDNDVASVERTFDAARVFAFFAADYLSPSKS